MTEIRFYHVQQDLAYKALPSLLTKALNNSLKIIVKTTDLARCGFYDDYLWRYHEHSFLPHATETDPHLVEQPIVITAQDQNPNNATMAVVLDGAELPQLESGQFSLVCTLFDSENISVLHKVREQWKFLKNHNPLLQMTYWKQQDNGSWAKQDI